MGPHLALLNDLTPLVQEAEAAGPVRNVESNRQSPPRNLRCRGVFTLVIPFCASSAAFGTPYVSPRETGLLIPSHSVRLGQLLLSTRALNRVASTRVLTIVPKWLEAT